MIENDMTVQNLQSAYGGESQAYQRYVVWGDKAIEDGFPKVGLLFEAVAFAEQVHAGNHFNVLADNEGEALVASGAAFGIGTTAENLTNAKAGEDFEIEQMYPTYHLVAKNQEETEALTSFYYALEAEKDHSVLFAEAKEAVAAGDDYDIDYLAVCEVCGHTVVDETPEKCSICGKGQEEFKEFGN